jgi:hypothetical protein
VGEGRRRPDLVSRVAEDGVADEAVNRSGATRCHEEVGCGNSCRSGRHKKRTPSWRRRLLHLDLRASEVGEGRRPDLVSGV